MKLQSLIIALSLLTNATAQNVGIGTVTPEAKLHVQGDLKVQNGVAINKFSTDSLFLENSHSNIPTEKAIKDYVQKGNWVAGSNSIPGSQAPLARGIASVNTSGANSVYTQGNFAFVTTYNNNLTSFNVSNPDSIFWRQSISTNLSFPVNIFVQGSYAYVISQGNDRLCIFDISNPANIIPKAFTSTNMRTPNTVFVQGNYAYVTSELNNNMSIHDISNPNAIVAKGFISTNMNFPTDIFVQGNYAYVTSVGNNRLCIYDISNPDAIVAKGFINTLLSDPVSVSVKGSYAYVASRANNRLCVYNISNPDIITSVGFSSTNLTAPNSISIAGNIAYVTSFDYNMLTLFDISNPLSIVSKGYSYANLSGPADVYASGDYAYVASYNNSRLCIFDLDKNGSLVSTPSGVQVAATQWQVSGSDIYRSNGNVGIGTSALPPDTKLQVAGNTIIDGNLGIGSTETVVPIQMASSLGNKLLLYGDGYLAHYGMGIQGGLLQLYTDAAAADIAFGYGNSNSFTERMRIKGNGNIGINTISPSNKLTVNGNANLTGNLGIGNATPAKPLSFPALLGEKILLYPGGVGEVGIGVYGNELRLHADNPGASVSFGTQDNAGTFTQAGRFQISGGYALYVNGSIWANGTTYASDERFKQNITAIKSPLQKLLQLNGVEYEMKADEFSKNHFLPGRQMGLLAQNVETIVPEAVHEKDGYKGVDYARLVPLLIESIKEQNKKIEEQQKQIDEQKKMIEQLLKKQL